MRGFLPEAEYPWPTLQGWLNEKTWSTFQLCLKGKGKRTMFYQEGEKKKKSVGKRKIKTQNGCLKQEQKAQIGWDFPCHEAGPPQTK